MTLKTCIEIGKDCGLHTLEECIRNVHIHANMMFPVGRINEELAELNKDLETIDVDLNADITTLILER